MGLPLSTSLTVSVSLYAIIPVFIYLAVRRRLDAKHERNLRLTCVGSAAIAFAVDIGVMGMVLLHLASPPMAAFFLLGLASSSLVLGVFLGFRVLGIPASTFFTGGLEKSTRSGVVGGTALLLLPLITLSPALYVIGYTSSAYFTPIASLVIVALSALIKGEHD